MGNFSQEILLQEITDHYAGGGKDLIARDISRGEEGAEIREQIRTYKPGATVREIGEAIQDMIVTGKLKQREIRRGKKFILGITI